MIEWIEMRESIKMEAVAIRIREFFRFCGILVNYVSKTEDENIIDFRVKQSGSRDITVCSIELSNKMKCGKALNTVISEFKKNDVEILEKRCISLMEKIKKCYVNNHLDYHIYNLIHFHTIENKMNEAYESFMAAYIFLYEEKKSYLKKDKKVPFALTYSKISCAKRINEICRLRDRKNSLRQKNWLKK